MNHHSKELFMANPVCIPSSHFFFYRSTSVHGALKALPLCAIHIYYWH